MSPRDAHSLLEQNFASSVRSESLTGLECWTLLARLAADRTAGGRTHDAHVLAAAVKARATVLLTFDVGEFAAVARDDIEIRSPLARP